MQNQQFGGANKTNTSFLSPLERRLSPIVVPKIPSWLQTHHLTMLTLIWSLLILGFSYLAATDVRWLWGVSLMIFFQYLTDHYDGKVGKYRNTGLLRWGYYMDHLLDYVFLCSVIIGYAFILPEKSRYQLLFLLAVFAAFAVSAFLAFSATDRLTISYLKLGPTEFRLALIVINTLLILFGTRYMISGLKYVNAGAVAALCFVVYQTQKNIWQIDMREKEREKSRQVAVAKTYATPKEVYVFTSVSEPMISVNQSKGFPVS
ncbi:MAG: CDP-alcohol phosphatidyltransferase family protein [Pyrinomonadaceae bacterium]|nr:CDP-alcohol phosphatidyltransferase family protein [Pyrinomonadaceae bacterium]